MTKVPSIKTQNDGARFWREFIGVEALPANSKEKKPLYPWKPYQTTPSTDKEFQDWIDTNAFANGVCILTGKVRHRPERQNLFFVMIDGDKPDGIRELFTRNGYAPPTLQEVAEKWIVEQHKDRPEKAHFGFYSPIRFSEKWPDPILGLEIRCEDSDGKTNRVVTVTPSIHKDGHPYEIIGTKDPVVLSELQALELKQHINQICMRNGIEYLTKTGSNSKKLDPKIKKMTRSLKLDDSIKIMEGQRNDILIAIADSILFNHSHKHSEEELRKYFDLINEQLCKPEPLATEELDRVWQSSLRFVDVSKEKEKEKEKEKQKDNGTGDDKDSSDRDNDDEVRLPDDLAFYGLDKDVYGIMNLNPPILAVARSNTRQITKAKVTKHEHTDKHGGIGSSEITYNLMWITPIIDAITIKVVRNENPLEISKISYTVTFVSKDSKKPFTVGPTTIRAMVEELTDKGLVLKRLDAIDALTSLIVAYRRKQKIEINDEIPTPGYYWLDGKIVGYHVTQRLDFDPWNNEEHKKEVIECIEIHNQWQQRNKKKTILPSVLKWAALAPFSFITKTRSKSVDKWLPNLYLYETTDTGKTTMIRDAVLASWAIYPDEEHSHLNFKGPGNLDSPSKFGNAASQTAMPVLGDEIGDLFGDSNKYGYNNMLDLQKYSVQNKFMRTRFNDDILALASFAYTSNNPPPQDSAARRRFFAIQLYNNEVWTEEEKKNYEAWMNEVDPITGKSTRQKLSVFGDFIASYVIKHPELILEYRSYSWHESATLILKEFYKCANIQPPSWLDLLHEQTIIQEAKEESQFELSGFLQQQIIEAYRRDIYANPDPATLIETENGSVRSTKPVTFVQKMDYCLNNRSITFLHKCNRNLGQDDDIAITSNIRSKLKEYNKTATAASMETLASKIPDFSYSQRWIGKDKVRVICGPISKFREYLDYKITEDEARGG